MSFSNSSGGTLTVPSPTHVHHVDVLASSVRSLRRSLSRSPSKFSLAPAIALPTIHTNPDSSQQQPQHYRLRGAIPKPNSSGAPSLDDLDDAFQLSTKPCNTFPPQRSPLSTLCKDLQGNRQPFEAGYSTPDIAQIPPQARTERYNRIGGKFHSFLIFKLGGLGPGK
ncbi:hypothetical protein ColTof4_00543 [Colletotrichum tofieldiae]|nr:hypothetical protein ColTof3_07749 [Colletotrichum tofieldiae]GKT68120.1 hypothetical protein ColTof4_00543 [Colletotrichum tofieldiae]